MSDAIPVFGPNYVTAHGETGQPRGPISAKERMANTRAARRFMFERTLEVVQKLHVIAMDDDHPRQMDALKEWMSRVAPAIFNVKVQDDVDENVPSFEQLEAEDREIERRLAEGEYRPLRLIRLPGDASGVRFSPDSPHTGAGGANSN